MSWRCLTTALIRLNRTKHRNTSTLLGELVGSIRLSRVAIELSLVTSLLFHTSCAVLNSTVRSADPISCHRVLMSKPPVQQPRRSRDHPAFVPNTVTRARYIIRTRAQAQHLGSRPPLHDALTNSPTKMPRQAHGQTKGAGAAENSGLQSKKRALSPSPHDDPPEAPAKRLKPLVFSTPSTRPAVLPAPLAESRCSDELADATTPRLQQFPVIVGSPDRSYPTAGLSTPTASPMKVVAAVPSDDIFNPTIPQVQGGSSHNHQQQINIDHTIHDLNETPLPGPKLFDVSVRTDDEQTPHAGPSHRRTFSVASEDETMVLDSPSKKAKLSSGLPALPKSSMIPRRIPTQPITKQSLITSFLQAPNAQRSQPSTITKGPVVGTHIPLPRKASAPHSPTKRSVSSGEDKSQLSGAPSRPSTSLGFSDPSRRSSLQVSTQESLSNLEMALEKLKIPRMRASIGVASAPPANPAAKLNSTRPSGAPTARASVGSARPIARAPSFRTASLGSGAAGPSAGGRTGPPGPRVGLGRPTAGGPARRVLSSMGPPPARSAGMALNVQSSTAAADAPATSSPAPLPSTADPEATQTPPSAEAATREDKRNRRASIALRSLAGGSGSSPDAPGSLPATEPIDGGGSTEKKRAKKLTILKDCVIFVDVKTDDGSDAGELFINMLKGLGGRVGHKLFSITDMLIPNCNRSSAG